MNTRRYQYSLRTLFIAMTIPGLWIGMERSWAQRERRAAAVFLARGGWMESTPQWDLLTPQFLPMGRSSTGPPWLRSMLGDECFSVVIAIHASDTSVDDEALAWLHKLAYLEELDLSGTRISNDGMAQLASLQRLDRLSLWGTKVTGQGLSVLETLPELTSLSLDVDQMTPAGVESLKQCPKLASISIRGTTGLSNSQLDRIRAKFPGVYVDLD